MNVQRMKLCGAEIIPVKSGSQTLKDAINEALRYYVSNSEKTYYLFGTAPDRILSVNRTIFPENNR